MAQQQQKNPPIKAPQKPQVNLPPRPQVPTFNKPNFRNNLPKFGNMMRLNQNRGSGGK